jgi:4Fe-4S ferredoxin
MCPADAITMEHKLPTSDDPTVSSDIIVDKDKCVYCLICKKSCPVDAIKAACRSCSYGEYDLNPEDAETTGASFIDQETCVNCGWCQEICPVDAATVVKPFEGELSVDQEKCQACGACVDICPCNVLSFPASSASGMRPEKVMSDENYCIYCGACENVCPVKAIEVKRTDIKHTPTKSKSWDKKMESLKT